MFIGEIIEVRKEIKLVTGRAQRGTYLKRPDTINKWVKQMDRDFPHSTLSAPPRQTRRNERLKKSAWGKELPWHPSTAYPQDRKMHEAKCQILRHTNNSEISTNFTIS